MHFLKEKNKRMSTNPVVAIPPSYADNGELETKTTCKYLNYLETRNVPTVMTTTGTSQFNLLTVDEIHKFNANVVESFSGHKIIGMPALSTYSAVEFVKKAQSYVDNNTHFMALYPERYYSNETIKNYINSIREHTHSPFYVHAMVMRSGYGGNWNYSSEVLSDLFESGFILGIKEEHSDFKKSYDFLKELPKNMDIIVAGGSMRRHQYLYTAGANAFLSGIGNLFPEIELGYCQAIDASENITPYLELETKLFNVFIKNGWHQSLRIALDILKLTCTSDRMPWPKREKELTKKIKNVIKEIVNEK